MSKQRIDLYGREKDYASLKHTNATSYRSTYATFETAHRRDGRESDRRHPSARARTTHGTTRESDGRGTCAVRSDKNDETISAHKNARTSAGKTRGMIKVADDDIRLYR
ncbi:hypothetical protein EVAR_96021_1 [Eumeta japonica]|uniref:Uncharacterized protein n=1 Tax=Eumeta variegata TaxID=151549 RepID=A0A4C1XHT5_EUMVA|nr:hypothetical protein EVAR_96021_1 [Eumeta japonica]